MNIGSSLQPIIASGQQLWKLRDRRNAIDARVAELRTYADAMAACRDIRAHASTIHKINRLLDERIVIVEQIRALSGHVAGMANATARRVAG